MSIVTHFRNISRIALTILLASGYEAVAADLTGDSGEFEGMPYRLVKPEVRPGAKYPLVVCLHSAAGRGTDNRARGIEAFAVLSRPEIRKAHPAFLLAPQCAEKFQWADAKWSDGPYDLDQTPESEYMKKVVALIKKLQSDFPIDPARVMVTGQSMGGFGTWDLILRHPEMVAAAIPICGGGSPKHAARIADLPVWNFHGAKDATVPVRASREMSAALKTAGATRFRYTEYPDGGHVIMRDVWATEGLIDWLFAQRRGTTSTPDSHNEVQGNGQPAGRGIPARTAPSGCVEPGGERKRRNPVNEAQALNLPAGIRGPRSSGRRPFPAVGCGVGRIPRPTA